MICNVRLDLNVDSFRLNCICNCARKKERNRKDGGEMERVCRTETEKGLAANGDHRDTWP